MAGESAGAAARRMREKAERLQRAADLWERGAAGEAATGAVLDQLPRPEWTVFHDLRWPGRQRANIDHVVVGPPGVFVIDSKHWTGKVTAHAGVLRQNGRLRQPTVAAASEAARAIARVTTSTAPTNVHPVLCFVREEPFMARSGEVALCSTANLLTLLQARPSTLTEATRARVCREIGAYDHLAADAGRSPRPVRAPGTSSARASTKLRQLVAALACFALAIGGIATVAASDVPQRIGELLTSVTETEDPEDEPRKVDRRDKQKDKKSNRQEKRPRPTR